MKVSAFDVTPASDRCRPSRVCLQLILLVACLFCPSSVLRAQPANGPQSEKSTTEGGADDRDGLEVATFGSGCFWCAEAVFQQLKGIKSVVSGYSGGLIKYPTYEQVCTGETGHAEVIQVTYDPKVISFTELLEVFWKTHDPTTLNRQGPDFGTQYRSVIFYHDQSQKELAEEYRKKLDKAKAFKKAIVTEISPFKEFFPAEDYHQNYFRSHPENPYCSLVIQSKVTKVKNVFKDKVVREKKGNKESE